MRMVREFFRETLYARYGVYIQRITCKSYLKLKAEIKTFFPIIAERQYCNRFFSYPSKRLTNAMYGLYRDHLVVKFDYMFLYI